MDNNDLLQRIEALEKWKEERTLQQIVYPLDFQSIEILNKYFMRIVNVIQYVVTGASDHTITSYIGQQGGESVTNATSNLLFQITPETIFQYTVDASTDVVTASGGSFVDGNAVHLNTSPGGAFPAPLAVNTTYYIVNATSRQSFQLSATVGGAAINVTTAGTGSQFIELDL